MPRGCKWHFFSDLKDYEAVVWMINFRLKSIEKIAAVTGR